jgi:putative MFS transporter
LAANRRGEEARKSLQYIGVTEEAICRAGYQLGDHLQGSTGQNSSIGELFSRVNARRIVHTWSLWFFQSLSYWAFVVWLPTIYATVYHIQLTRTLFYTFIVAGASVLGRFTALILVDRIGRKPLIVGGCLLAGVTAWFFNIATTETTLVGVAVAYAFFGDQVSLGMTVYTPEVYPLAIRGLGTAWAMGFGRLGGAVSPFLVGLLLGTKKVSLVWWAMGGCLLVAGIMSAWLATETRGLNLEQASRGTVPLRAE